MRLSNKEFKRWNDLKKMVEEGKELSSEEKKQLLELTAKKESSEPGKKGKQFELATNDPMWYKKYPELFEICVKLAFNAVIGEAEILGSSSSGLTSMNVPAVQTINFIPTPGKLDGIKSGFNWQNQQLYLAMHRKYRGLGGYQSADLGCAMLAICDFFANISRAERIYGALYEYQVFNRSVPKQLLEALGISEEYGRITGAELAGFLFDINRIIEAAKSKLLLPKGISAFDMYFARYSFIYKDSDSSRASLMLFDSPYFLTYSGRTANTGSVVKYNYRTYSPARTDRWGRKRIQTLDNIITDLYTQLNILLTDSDVVRMCSDYLAAFKDGAEIHDLAALPIEYKVPIIKDDYMTLQIHNATMVGEVFGTNIKSEVYDQLVGGTHTPIESLTIYQVDNVLYQNLAASANAQYIFDPSHPQGYLDGQLNQLTGRYTVGVNDDVAGEGEKYPTVFNQMLIDIWKDDPSDDDIVEMTRLTTLGEYGHFQNTLGGNTFYNELKAYGMFICLTIDVYASDSATFLDSSYAHEVTSAQPITNVTQIADLSTLLRSFKWDWSPILYFYEYNPTSKSISRIVTFGDVDNYKAIDYTWLRKLHDCCSMSVWNKAIVGKSLSD